MPAPAIIFAHSFSSNHDYPPLVDIEMIPALFRVPLIRVKTFNISLGGPKYGFAGELVDKISTVQRNFFHDAFNGFLHSALRILSKPRTGWKAAVQQYAGTGGSS